MAIIPDPRQVWLNLPEPALRFGAAALPEPLPEFGTDAYRAAPPDVRRAAWEAYDREVAALFDRLGIPCLGAGVT